MQDPANMPLEVLRHDLAMKPRIVSVLGLPQVAASCELWSKVSSRVRKVIRTGINGVPVPQHLVKSVNCTVTI